jgi:nucleoside-diphosphate-sugar epimerase
VPLGVHGKNGSFQVLKRISEGKPVIIHGDGTSLWTITHARDFARGYRGLLGNVHAIGEAVQIMSSETVSWNQIYQMIAAALGKKLNAVHISSEFLTAASKNMNYDFLGSLIGDKANSVVFDTSRLQRLVPGFCAQIPAAVGIRETVEYVFSHPECRTPDEDFDAWCDKVIDVLDKAAKEIASL